jgi:hypothetical protein
MKENKIIIEIKKPIQEVFEFCIQPKNTPLWIEELESESTNEWPIKNGTLYTNTTLLGKTSVLEVVEVVPHTVFELASRHDAYHVRYTFRVKDASTELEYYEWVDDGVLEAPFSQKQLQKLKNTLEQTS